ncbi:MAG: 16S rRNA (cytidine(1402)-2'-O)-methyltransferase [Candidatus Wildermuthbacteria bacterium]|nr:16S rRNA (cytidine(1402)-2'-O)-methyltransferase [Candidatus Wildermuthbacteria bacterium]
MGTLFVVATPIGNLEDFTFRALRTLKQVDLILCEDTRVTRKLLAHYNIEKPLLSYHQHSKENKMQEIFDLLSQDKNLALVSDAGTPGISDPGNELIAWLFSHSTKTKQLSDFCTIPIVPIPGPSALLALASVAGIPMDKFLFLGYPPHKKGRKKFFEEVSQSVYPVIFYESPFRVLKSLREIQSLNPNLFAVIGRELTKKFETLYRGTLAYVLEQLEREKIRGEFVIIAAKSLTTQPPSFTR